MLTPEEKKRLAEKRQQAREAERLSMECLEGTAPEFGFDSLYKRISEHEWVPNCVFGHLCRRARYCSYNPQIDEHRIVAEANDLRLPIADRHAALVFPLLALRDALLEAP